MAKSKEASEKRESVTLEDLSDQDRQALLFQHKKTYEARLAAKKKADADFKNACKIAKSDLGENAVSKIKLAIELDTPEGEARFKAKMESDIEVSRWMGVELGTQAEMFGDAAKSGDRVMGEGKRAGLAGEPKKTTYAPGTKDYDLWMGGYDIGQQVLARKSFQGKSGAIGTEKPTHTHN